jgi:hypothetical protein
MGIYTPSQSVQDTGSDIWLRCAMLLQLRALAFGSGLALSIVSGLYQLITEGPVDLAAWSFGGFFAGEIIALISTAPMTIRIMPLTTLLHVGTTAAWLFALLRYGAPIWSAAWVAAGLAGG